MGSSSILSFVLTFLSFADPLRSVFLVGIRRKASFGSYLRFKGSRIGSKGKARCFFLSLHFSFLLLSLSLFLASSSHM